MKKSILICALTLLIAVSSAYANNAEGVNQRVINNFNKEFVQASDVSWEVNKKFLKAKFSLNNQVLFAYYTPEGEKIAVIRNLTTNQLPLTLQAKLRKQFQNYWITDLFEITNGEESTYYVTVENPDQVVTLKSEGTFDWSQFKKTVKE